MWIHWEETISIYEVGYREEVNCVRMCLTADSTAGRIELAAQLSFVITRIQPVTLKMNIIKREEEYWLYGRYILL